MFKNILRGKVVIVGVGDTLRGDDGFGPALIARLKGMVKAVCLGAGSAPENFTDKIVKEKPDTILIVDALHLGLPPGEYEILKKDDIVDCGFSTHDISPRMFIEYLENQTKASIYMLGVQPKNLSFGQEIADSVKNTLAAITDLIKEADNA
ncbi:MAG: hydrogenase 3 maturation endopeptidase HyCI [Desulfobacterales bacterium]|nr:hydrogenase 3 maturation endopeptidase HyCI [Desulfobacterales bacterium]